jgi:hypothetical protein
MSKPMRAHGEPGRNDIERLRCRLKADDASPHCKQRSREAEKQRSREAEKQRSREAEKQDI